jgi:hypothetical protein
MFEAGNVKRGCIGSSLGKTNLSVQLVRLDLKSSRRIEPFALGWMDEACKDHVNPEVMGTNDINTEYLVGKDRR